MVRSKQTPADIVIARLRKRLPLARQCLAGHVNPKAIRTFTLRDAFELGVVVGALAVSPGLFTKGGR
jgi:hypothetical protein